LTESSEDPSAPPTHSPDTAARRELNQLFSLAYEELRRLAANVRRNDPNATVTPTTIVNEAWLKLSRTPDVADASQLHFKRIAACAMRQVLVDAARRRIAGSHGGGWQHVSFDDALGLTGTAGSGTSDDRQVIALDAAMMTLQKLQPRQAALVEARFFGGLETSEVAELLGISEATALRDWRAAKAWLAVEVRKALA
jgi:RNA polymerase sigma factor (TIGR02999 family)